METIFSQHFSTTKLLNGYHNSSMEPTNFLHPDANTVPGQDNFDLFKSSIAYDPPAGLFEADSDAVGDHAREHAANCDTYFDKNVQNVISSACNVKQARNFVQTRGVLPTWLKEYCEALLPRESPIRNEDASLMRGIAFKALYDTTLANSNDGSINATSGYCRQKDFEIPIAHSATFHTTPHNQPMQQGCHDPSLVSFISSTFNQHASDQWPSPDKPIHGRDSNRNMFQRSAPMNQVEEYSEQTSGCRGIEGPPDQDVLRDALKEADFANLLNYIRYFFTALPSSLISDAHKPKRAVPNIHSCGTQELSDRASPIAADLNTNLVPFMNPNIFSQKFTTNPLDMLSKLGRDPLANAVPNPTVL